MGDEESSKKEEKTKIPGFRVFLTETSSFSYRITKYLAYKIKKIINEQGHCIIGVCSGPMMADVYEGLGKESIPWQKVYIFLVEEKHVEKTHSESVTRLVQETLFAEAKIPDDNFIRPDTSLPTDLCVEDYQEALQRINLKGSPDIVLLSLGEDGHVGALFPIVSAANLQSDELVLHTTTRKFPVKDRITVSFRQINSADTIVFLVYGEKRSKLWQDIISEKKPSIATFRRYPALYAFNSKQNITVFSCPEAKEQPHRNDDDSM
eukprot:TRINITY_DN4102_c1_g1_i1.p1 TRINITY_DN4102_c1_g1~~TRINITY_DN4102_c1_g1_i1.p1  ORF type:complete len:264 (+),score=33.84 TRINITY_DN4102_c1_g1_i1:85-876(+)